MISRRRLTALAVAALLPLTACADGGDEENPLDDDQPEAEGGAAGPDTAVSEDVSLLQVQLEYPLDGAYHEDEDASLYFGIANTGTQGDTLTDISGEAFADAQMADGGDIHIDVPENDNVYVGAEGEPAVTLIDLQEELRSSESISITFEFQHAGQVTVDAMVAASGQNPTPTVDFPDPDENTTQEGAESTEIG